MKIQMCAVTHAFIAGRPIFSPELSFDFGHFSEIMPHNREKSLKFMLQKSNTIVNVIAFEH